MSIYAKQHVHGASLLAAAVGTALTTFLTPAANADGVMIRAILFESALTINIYADTAAPGSRIDLTKRVIAINNSPTTNDAIVAPLPLWLPAGIGIYGWAGGAGGNTWIMYDAG